MWRRCKRDRTSWIREESIEKNKIEYDDSPTSHNNPILLLKKLKNVNDLSERNEIIDKIESIISDIFTRYEKK